MPRKDPMLFAPENVVIKLVTSLVSITVRPYRLGETVYDLLAEIVGSGRGQRRFTDCGGGGSENTRWFSVLDTSEPNKKGSWLEQVVSQLEQELQKRGVRVVIRRE